jgi:hypothetical protein
MLLLQPRAGGFRLRCFRTVVLALYVAAAATLPLLHHDIACHVQSPAHCTTCLVGTAEKASDADALSAARLVLIGSLNIEAQRWRAPLLSGDTSGRSPPAIV